MLRVCRAPFSPCLLQFHVSARVSLSLPLVMYNNIIVYYCITQAVDLLPGPQHLSRLV